MLDGVVPQPSYGNVTETDRRVVLHPDSGAALGVGRG